jgi:N-formylglutamate deformylase
MTSPLFTVRPSQRHSLPIVVSVPHAGLRLPESRHELMGLPEEVFLRDVDFEIHRMWESVCQARDVSLVKSEIHRYALDLNRRPDQVDAGSVNDSSLPSLNERPHDPKGLIWTESTRKESLGPGGGPFRPLPLATVRELVDSLWRPYYATIERELEAVRAKFGYALLIDGHSMPSKGTAFHADPGKARAEIVPGDFKGKSCDARFTQAVLAACAEQGFSTMLNDPYSGGNITQHFGQPARGIHAIQIEVNRVVYVEDEETVPKRLRADGLARLEKLAHAMLERARLG